MTQHLHSTFVEGCYRCDLSRDEVTADVNVTEKVARAILSTEWEDPRGIHPPMRHEAQSHYAYWCPLCRPDLDDNGERIAAAALSALADPEVLAGIAGALRTPRTSGCAATPTPRVRRRPGVSSRPLRSWSG